MTQGLAPSQGQVQTRTNSQSANQCVLRTNPEVNESKEVGVGPALHQMVNFLRFHPELAPRPIHPDSGRKQPKHTAAGSARRPGAASPPAPSR